MKAKAQLQFRPVLSSFVDGKIAYYGGGQDVGRVPEESCAATDVCFVSPPPRQSSPWTLPEEVAR